MNKVKLKYSNFPSSIDPMDGNSLAFKALSSLHIRMLIYDFSQNMCVSSIYKQRYISTLKYILHNIILNFQKIFLKVIHIIYRTMFFSQCALINFRSSKYTISIDLFSTNKSTCIPHNDKSTRSSHNGKTHNLATKHII